jgi:hypothetical protein
VTQCPGIMIPGPCYALSMPRRKAPPTLPNAKRLLRALNADPTQRELDASNISTFALLAGIFGTPNKFTPEDVRAMVEAVRKCHHDDPAYTERFARAWAPYMRDPEDNGGE